MNKILLLLFVFVGCVTAFTLGCSPDSCADNKVECGANGACSEGLCVCSDGYEGEKCETPSRNRFFVGTSSYASFKTNINADNCDSAGYSMGFTPAIAVNQIVVGNVLNLGTNATMLCNIKRKSFETDALLTFTAAAPLTLGTTTISDFKGSINAANTEITYTYTKVTGGVAGTVTITCTAKATKQL